MVDDEKQSPKFDEAVPDATPHNPGLAPTPGSSAGDDGPAEGAPYEKKPDPAQQPS